MRWMSALGQKLTSRANTSMSAMCHKRTSRQNTRSLRGRRAPRPVMLARRTGIYCPLGAWRRTVSTLRVQLSRRPATALLQARYRPASGRYEWRSRMSPSLSPPLTSPFACLLRRARHQGTVPGRQFRRSPWGRLRSRWPRRRRQRAQRYACLPHQSLWTGALCWRDL